MSGTPGWEPTADLPPTFDKIEPQTPPPRGWPRDPLGGRAHLSGCRQLHADDELCEIREPGSADDLPWAIEAGVLCVVCPGCAFTFDANHEDDDKPEFYTCPVCNTHGPIATNE